MKKTNNAETLNLTLKRIWECDECKERFNSWNLAQYHNCKEKKTNGE